MITKFKIYEFSVYSNDSDEEDDDYIFDRVYNNDYDYVKSYFDNDGDPNVITDEKNLLIQATIEKNIIDLDIIKLLIKNGVDVNYINTEENDTPITYAAYYDEFSVVELLIDAGADPFHQDESDHDVFYYLKLNQTSLYNEFIEWLQVNHNKIYRKYRKSMRKKDFNL